VSRVIYVEFLVDARTLGQAFPEHLGCRLSTIIQQMLHIHLFVIRGMGDDPSRGRSSNKRSNTPPSN